MDVKVFFLLFIFQIRVVVSKNCSCYVGHAKHTGEVHLKLENCTPLPTLPPSINTTSAAPETSGPTQQKPDNTTQKPDTTAQEPANTTGINITINEPTVATEILITTGVVPQNSTTERDVSPSATSPSKKTSASTTATLQGSTTVQEQQPACCQILIMNQNQSKKLSFNPTSGWIANFSCFNSSSENVFKCNNSGCNDIQFLKNYGSIDKQFKVPNHCTNGTNGYKTKEAIIYEDFMWENSISIEACTKKSRNKCSNFNLTQGYCPSQSKFCCCPLQDDVCHKPTTPNSSAVPAAPRTSKHHGNHQHKSFKWRIVGYIGTAVVCFIFLAFVGRIIHGKNRNDELDIPNYQYSRLRADYVEQED